MVSHFALLDLGVPQMLIILTIVLLLFGSKRLPELSRSLGESARELKNAMNEPSNEKTKDKNENNREAA